MAQITFSLAVGKRFEPWENIRVQIKEQSCDILPKKGSSEPRKALKYYLRHNKVNYTRRYLPQLLTLGLNA